MACSGMGTAPSSMQNVSLSLNDINTSVMDEFADPVPDYPSAFELSEPLSEWASPEANSPADLGEFTTTIFHGYWTPSDSPIQEHNYNT